MAGIFLRTGLRFGVIMMLLVHITSSEQGHFRASRSKSVQQQGHIMSGLASLENRESLQPFRRDITANLEDGSPVEHARGNSANVSEFLDQEVQDIDSVGKRFCMTCGNKKVCKGIEGSVRKWKHFLCRRCHKVHKGVKLLNLYRRCAQCSRWAVFGLRRGKVDHCGRHKKPDEFDVLHVYKRSGTSKSLGSTIDDKGGTQMDIPVDGVAQDALSDLLSFSQRSNSVAHSTKSQLENSSLSLPVAWGRSRSVNDSESQHVPSVMGTSSGLMGSHGVCTECCMSTARFGVSDASRGGEWIKLLCRLCKDDVANNTAVLSLLQRCTSCDRHAVFGPQYKSTSISVRHKLPIKLSGAGLRFGGKRLRCSRHRLKHDVDSLHQRCLHPGCTTIPSFGQESNGRPIYCARHKTVNHTYLRLGRCQSAECVHRVSSSSSSFCFSHAPGGGGASPRQIVATCQGDLQQKVDRIPYTSESSLSGQGDAADWGNHEELEGDREWWSRGTRVICTSWHAVTSRGLAGGSLARARHGWVCEYPEGCTRAAYFTLSDASEGQSRTSKFCRDHCDSSGLVTELRKRKQCAFSGCHRQASFARSDQASSLPSPLRAKWCALHAGSQRLNVVSSRCSSPGCATIGSFGPQSGEHVRRCREHRLEGDVDVRNKRCEASASCNRRVYKKVIISDSTVRACAQCYLQWKQQDTKGSRYFPS